MAAFSKILAVACFGCLLLAVAGCATAPGNQGAFYAELPAVDPLLASFPAIRSIDPSTVLALESRTWQPHRFPGKRPTEYRYRWLDQRHTVEASAKTSASMLRQRLRMEPAQLESLNFSWKVPHLIPGADLTRRETHDSPVRLVLVFEGDRSTFSTKNAMLSELARTLTGEEMPYATLMYTWCNACDAEKVIRNPRTDRIREIPLESGDAHLNRWLDYRRDIRADFQSAFGEAPGALLGVSFMTDTDNTGENATAFYGPVFFSR